MMRTGAHVGPHDHSRLSSTTRDASVVSWPTWWSIQ